MSGLFDAGHRRVTLMSLFGRHSPQNKHPMHTPSATEIYVSARLLVAVALAVMFAIGAVSQITGIGQGVETWQFVAALLAGGAAVFVKAVWAAL